jgi:hypothetical protein
MSIALLCAVATPAAVTAKAKKEEKAPPAAGAQPKKKKKPAPAKVAKGFRPAIGIADQKPGMFADARFRALGIRAVRINVPWDVLKDPEGTARLDAWMAGARSAGARPFVTFDRSVRRPSYNPSAAEMAFALLSLRRRYPGLREFSTWNEANINKRPEIVARWYRALRRACPKCTILATDLLDRGNAISWARRFTRAAGRVPGHWGIHNYVGVNNRSLVSTRAIIHAIPGRFWLTETGGVVSRNNRSPVYFPSSVPHAAAVTAFLLGPVVKAFGARIERIYFYHWDIGPGAPDTWDSAFIGPDGRSRPALGVLARSLGRTLPAAP